MNADIETVRQLFSDVFLNATSDLIEEPGENMKRILNKGRIENDNVVVYRLDQNENKIDLFPYIKNSRDSKLKGMRKICDFAIFVSHAGDLYALLIEMKKGKESPQKQLDVTVPLIEFVFRRAKLLGYWKSNVIIRKIGVSDCTVKRDTVNRGEINYENDYVKLYNGKCLYLERFLH